MSSSVWRRFQPKPFRDYPIDSQKGCFGRTFDYAGTNLRPTTACHTALNRPTAAKSRVKSQPGQCRRWHDEDEFCCSAVLLLLARCERQAAMRRRPLLGVKPTRRDPFPDFSARFPGFSVGDSVRIRHLRVRILSGQPASAVSVGHFRVREKSAPLPPLGGTFVSLCG